MAIPSADEIIERVNVYSKNKDHDIIRKARNCHSKHTAKNFDEETYKKATAFEALLGWLYLNEKAERLSQFLQISVQE